MIYILSTAWALLLGLMLLMLGNGLQGTLLGVRGAIEGFDAGTMSWVMAAYFAGFLGGSRAAPYMIQRVGHVRVFAALASMISAAFILYAAIPDPWAWAIMRLIVGFCFSGVYVVVESWLNDIATNETRGQALSLYMIVQMVGVIAAQGVLNLGDPGGYTLFVVISVLVSISFAPILLSVTPAPVFQTSKRMTLVQLYQVSPLGCVGVFLLGLVFSAMFGMAAVYGTEKGLSLVDISIFVAALYIGGLVFQYPIGWVSDRMDRRILITIVTAIGAVLTLLGYFGSESFIAIVIAAFAIGGAASPLYSLFLAYTNDFLEHDEMAAASGGLLFVNGTGAILGPFFIGWMMQTYGADSFFLYLATLFALIAVYALYRMSQRPAPTVEETNPYAPVLATSTSVAVEVALEWAEEAADTENTLQNEHEQ